MGCGAGPANLAHSKSTYANRLSATGARVLHTHAATYAKSLTPPLDDTRCCSSTQAHGSSDYRRSGSGTKDNGAAGQRDSRCSGARRRRHTIVLIAQMTRPRTRWQLCCLPALMTMKCMHEYSNQMSRQPVLAPGPTSQLPGFSWLLPLFQPLSSCKIFRLHHMVTHEEIA